MTTEFTYRQYLKKQLLGTLDSDEAEDVTKDTHVWTTKAFNCENHSSARLSLLALNKGAGASVSIKAQLRLAGSGNWVDVGSVTYDSANSRYTLVNAPVYIDANQTAICLYPTETTDAFAIRWVFTFEDSTGASFTAEVGGAL